MPKRLTNQEYVERLYTAHNGNIIPLEEYKGNEINIKVQCLTCNHVWSVRPNNSINNKRKCPKCKFTKNGILSTKSNDKFLIDLKIVHGEKYVPLTEYISAKKKIKFFCTNCHLQFYMTPDDLVNGKRNCSGCHLSYGANKIKEFLSNHNINFKMEYTFKNLKSSKNMRLRFDYAIFDDCDNLKYLIEFDGIQHFEPISKFGGVKGFETTKQNDLLKNKYCEEYGIKLIRVSYIDMDNNINLEELFK